ncbi:MAG: single-stranded-DNA-specific exonuclease RecJ, partial [Anaerolineales bacterium]|nr:single-stranded-DNA-specific exonuclease RecJ [Anaerolineales bacterium]
LQEYPPILRQILFNRGYATQEIANQYLEAKMPPGTDASNLLGVPEATERIQYAIKTQERIAVYGDYDADGVTATALLVSALSTMGADVIGYIPNRFDEGYGLNNEALDNLRSDGTRLVITVDCGIRSPQETKHAQDIGLDMIISDHHHPDNELPQAVAVINPKQPQDTYPEKELAGVGLAYKLISALMGNSSDAESYLDLVALGTVADLAPLVGENRALVRKGLEVLRKPHRQGVMALIGVSGLKPNKIKASDIGFVLGPRLNAAGRLESALAALDLLTSSDVYQAAELAQQLDNQNRERQQITSQIQKQAEQLVLIDDPDALLLFAAHPDFNPGVVGLAASRLTELYYRPAIVAYRGEVLTRASCRSIKEFHITQALDQCADLLERHGGHAAAAGFTVKNENLPALINRLKVIANQELSQLDLRPTLTADVEIPLSDLKPEILDYLEWLQPTGYGNPQAHFVSRNLKVTRSRTVGKDNNHLKFTVTDGRITYDAIAFRQGHWEGLLPSRIDLLYIFETNEYFDRISLQLNVRDIKPTGTPD